MKEYFEGQVGAWLVGDEARSERIPLRDKVFNWLCAACGLLLLILALGGCATTKVATVELPMHVLEKDGVEIRLMNLPCVDPVSLAMVKPQYHPRLRAIESVWPERDGSRKAYAGCWAELTNEESGLEEESFLLVFEDNQSGVVPKSEFKKKNGERGA